MKSVLVAGLLIAVAGCAANDQAWRPSELEAKTVIVKFLTDEEWETLHKERTPCKNCEFVWKDVKGLADWSENTCVVYFPASQGMPDERVWTHELRHCFQGKHRDWN